MATQFTQQAESQLNPLYDQQTSALQAQIPSIQNLYSTLTQGLQSNYNTNLASGVQNINEDASARGVLRSTLPNDARTTLTSQLGSALQQSLGELNVKQASDISGVNTQIGNLGLQRVQSVNDLANSLQSNDLAERQFAQDQLNANRNYQLALASSASSSATSQAELLDNYNTVLNAGTIGGKKIAIRGEENTDSGKYISRESFIRSLVARYPDLDPQSIIDDVYQIYRG